MTKEHVTVVFEKDAAIVKMMNPVEQALDELSKFGVETSHRSIALSYAFAIRQNETANIASLNNMIVKVWDLKTLTKIKKDAWTLVYKKD